MDVRSHVRTGEARGNLDALRNHAGQVAQAEDIEAKLVRRHELRTSSIAAEIVEHRVERPGLVAVLSALEPYFPPRDPTFRIVAGRRRNTLPVGYGSEGSGGARMGWGRSDRAGSKHPSAALPGSFRYATGVALTNYTPSLQSEPSTARWSSDPSEGSGRRRKALCDLLSATLRTVDI